jgi:adenylate cyclase
MRFPNVSGIHCELTFKDGYWYIRDLGSTNGIKVNGVKVQNKLLHPKDEVTIAKRRYTIHYELPVTRRVLEDIEEDILSQPLLERAGLERPRHHSEPDRSSQNFDPAEFLLDDEQDD